MKKLFATGLIILYSLFISADTIDSLRSILDTAQNDSVRIYTMLNIGEAQYSDAPLTAIATWKAASKLADSLSSKYNNLIFFNKAKAIAYNNIGLVFKRIGQSDSAIKYLKLSYENYLKAKNDRDAAKSLIYIGMTYRIAGKLDSALKYYRLAAKQAETQDTLITALSYNNIGYIYRIKGETDKALNNYEHAYELYKQIDAQKYIPTTLNNIAGIHESKGDLAKAIEYYTKSLKIYEKLSYYKGIALLYNNIGHLYYELDDTANAMFYYRKSLYISKQYNNIVEQANTLKNIAILLKDKDNYADAKKYLQQSYSLLEKAGEKKLAATVGLLLGDLLYEKGQWDKAEEFYKKSKVIFEQIGDKEGMAQSYIKLSQIYYKKRQLNDAQKFALTALNLGIKLGFPAIQRDASKLLYSIYKEKHNYKLALENYLQFIKMRDSIVNIENKKATYKQQIKYEYEKQKAIEQAEHEKELQIMREREKRQKLAVIFLLFISALIISFAGYLYSRFRIIKKQKKIIEAQKHAIEETNKKLVDSINYAQRIQKAVLKPATTANSYIPEHFILFLPKDIVSGDFYWSHSKEQYWYIAAADCTGHGVPGALMSMLGISFLNEIVSHNGAIEPAEILEKLRHRIITELKQSENQVVYDGMDISLARIDLSKLELSWAGAHNPLWIIRKQNIIELKADKQTIGFNHRQKPFSNHKLTLYEGDRLYMFSDGYFDQFGGNGTKFMRKNFKKLLLETSSLDLNEQKRLLLEQLKEWQGAYGQTDDILVIGIKI